MMSFRTDRRMHGLLKLKMFIAQYFSSESTRFQLSDHTSLRPQYISFPVCCAAFNIDPAVFLICCIFCYCLF